MQNFKEMTTLIHVYGCQSFYWAILN